VTRGVSEGRHDPSQKLKAICFVHVALRLALRIGAQCGRRLSLQRSKGGKYVYFFCLGQKSRRAPTGCTQAYVEVGKLEQAMERLYEQIQLPAKEADRLRADVEAEIIAGQDRNAAEREFLSYQVAKLATERRKLLDAYYVGAVDAPTLKSEQDRIMDETRRAEAKVKAVDATLAEWLDILGIAFRFATSCTTAYHEAPERARRVFNLTIFERVAIKEGGIAEVVYRYPFDVLFRTGEFEQATLAGEEGFEPSNAGSKVRCLTTWRLPSGFGKSYDQRASAAGEPGRALLAEGSPPFDGVLGGLRGGLGEGFDFEHGLEGFVQR
jgi:hypothetical protein